MAAKRAMPICPPRLVAGGTILDYWCTFLVGNSYWYTD